MRSPTPRPLSGNSRLAAYRLSRSIMAMASLLGRLIGVPQRAVMASERVWRTLPSFLTAVWHPETGNIAAAVLLLLEQRV